MRLAPVACRARLRKMKNNPTERSAKAIPMPSNPSRMKPGSGLTASTTGSGGFVGGTSAFATFAAGRLVAAADGSFAAGGLGCEGEGAAGCVSTATAGTDGARELDGATAAFVAGDVTGLGAGSGTTGAGAVGAVDFASPGAG